MFFQIILYDVYLFTQTQRQLYLAGFVASTGPRVIQPFADVAPSIRLKGSAHHPGMHEHE